MAPITNPQSVPATYIRGGTSKAVFFHEKDIPPAGPGRDRFLIRIMGSPDNMQIDGMGGSHIVTSKVAIIRPSQQPDVDVDYTFAQISIDTPTVGYDGNCGNISAGVGPFAINEGLFKGLKGSDEANSVKKVKIYNNGSKKVLIAHVPVNKTTGRAQEKGNYSIAGAPGTGAPIFMDYSLVTGASLGKGMLPTGNASDTITLGGNEIRVTVCDVANIIVFVTAKHLGISGGEKAAYLNTAKDLIARVKELRGKAAALVGMCKDWRKVDEQAGFLPMVALVSSPTIEGAHVQSRLFLDNQCHSSMAGTGGVCTAACSRISGSVLQSVMNANDLEMDSLQIQHPSGILPVSVGTEGNDSAGLPVFKILSFVRTARYIFQGNLMVPEDLPDVWAESLTTANGMAESDGVPSPASDEREATTTPASAEPEAVTTALAKFVANTKQEDIKVELAKKLKELLLDHLGVGILGSKVAESCAPFRQAIDSLTSDTPGTATAFGKGTKYPAPYAAMLNAAFAHSLDFDDTHVEGVLHPGVSVIPTMLAEIEGKPQLDFQDALLAMAVGYELVCRVGSGLGPGGYVRGFHNTGVAGALGAVAALAKLRNLDAVTTETAFGIALSFTSGTMQWLENGSWNKRLNPGVAAHNAFTCVALAEAGVLGAAKAIEGKFGLLNAHSTTPSAKAVIKGLGEKWTFLDTGLKPFPACRLTHTAIEVADKLSGSKRSKPVKEIRVQLDKRTVPIVVESLPNKIHPNNIVEAQFSIYYQIAATWLYGSDQGWSLYDHLEDPAVHDLCDKIIVVPSELPSMIETSVEVTWQDGTNEQSSLKVPLWDGDRLPNYENVKRKFQSVTSGVLVAQKTGDFGLDKVGGEDFHVRVLRFVGLK